MVGPELHPARPPEALAEVADRLVGRPLEREDVCLRIAGDHQAPGTDAGQQRLAGERGVLVVVDHEVVEEWLPARRGRRCLLEEPGEVDQPGAVEDLLIPLREVGQLVPPGQPRRVRALADLGGLQQGLLRPRQELADLVGEAPEPEHRPVRRPSLCWTLAGSASW